MRTPDFLVVGAARAGTTTLHSYLRQHPEIFIPKIKEPCFFIFDGETEEMVNGKFSFAVRDFASYEKLFSSAGNDKKTGEMSTPYLYLYDKTIRSIRKYFTDYSGIKIIILLRDPAERAFSQYKWKVRDGREPLSFEQAIDAEQERMKQNFSFDYFYADRGFYYKQVKSFLENFRNVHVILFEDFTADPMAVLKNLSMFLEIDEKFVFKMEEIQNESSVPKVKSLSRLMTTENRLKYKVWYSIPDPLRKKLRKMFTAMNDSNKQLLMDDLMRKKLVERYRSDIIALQGLIQRDLSSWLR